MIRGTIDFPKKKIVWSHRRPEFSSRLFVSLQSFSVMHSFIRKREYGQIRPLRLVRAETTKRAYTLQLSRTKEIARSHRGNK